MSLSPVAAGSAGAAGSSGGSCCASACCWSYACWSWAPHRLACRRDTRFDTAVAVPATTAVRAIPPISPIIRPLCALRLRLRCRRFGLFSLKCIKHRLYLVGRDATAGDELCIGPPHGRDEWSGPGVFIHHESHHFPGLDQLRRLPQVVVIE